ncbi:HAD family hydrolase [Rhodococcus opacus]|uniref:HAD family hydrolase n=1 Tax=Rhodococcus opacus TaxID=37919 RepID=UPI001B303E77|nr:HAD-IB family phosphatase [Rhodococcus opacus]
MGVQTHPRQEVPTVDGGSRLHVFDMDGTLLMGAATVELSRYLGCFDAAFALEEAWLRGEISEVSFWHKALELWTGASEDEIDGAFEAAVWLKGIPEVFADIAERDERCIVISQSPYFFVRRLERWGAHATFGSRIELGGEVTEHSTLTVEDKVLITKRILDDWGLTVTECVAYGDSTSDISLFEWLPNTVGVNAKDPIRSLAAELYDGDDLRHAYTIGRRLIAGPTNTLTGSGGG